MNPAIPRFFRRALIVCILGLAAAYASDYVFLRIRMVSKFAGEPFGTVTVYDSMVMKNGKVQIFYERPQEEVCVRSLFPHFSHEPCWYLHRSPVRLIALVSSNTVLPSRVSSPSDPAEEKHRLALAYFSGWPSASTTVTGPYFASTS